MCENGIIGRYTFGGCAGQARKKVTFHMCLTYKFIQYIFLNLGKTYFALPNASDLIANVILIVLAAIQHAICSFPVTVAF